MLLIHKDIKLQNYGKGIGHARIINRVKNDLTVFQTTNRGRVEEGDGRLPGSVLGRSLSSVAGTVCTAVFIGQRDPYSQFCPSHTGGCSTEDHKFTDVNLT